MEEVLTRFAAVATSLQQRQTQLVESISQLHLRGAESSRDRIKPPTYDGSRAWVVFDAQFQGAVEENGWTPEVAGRRLLAALTGPAADLVQTLPPADFENYDRLRARLADHYGTTQRCNVAEAELDKRHQKSGESLRDLATDILRLTRVAHPTWPEDAIQTTSRKAFLSAIADPDLRRAVRLQPSTTLNEALTVAIHIESVDLIEPTIKRARTTQAAQVSVLAQQGDSDVSATPSTSTTEAEVDARRVMLQHRQPGSDDLVAALNSLRTTLQQQRDRQSRSRSRHRSRSRSRSRRRRSRSGHGSRHRRGFDGRCFYCDRRGHFKANCPDRANDKGRDDRRRSREDRPHHKGSGNDQ